MTALFDVRFIAPGAKVMIGACVSLTVKLPFLVFAGRSPLFREKPVNSNAVSLPIPTFSATCICIFNKIPLPDSGSVPESVTCTSPGLMENDGAAQPAAMVPSILTPVAERMSESN